jgi:quercetin dioxygenase-like cupin family protein
VPDATGDTGLVDHGALAATPPPRRDGNGPTTLPIGAVALAPGQATPLYQRNCSEYLYVQSGRVMAQRGLARVELEAGCSAYFPAGVFHGVSAGEEGASVLLCQVRTGERQEISTEIHEGPEPQDWPNPNVIRGIDLNYRWAVAEEYEPWLGVEPSKGMALRLRYLFTPDRGAPDVTAGLAENSPGMHYTLHRHQPAELYYVLEGTGTIHVGDQSLPAQPGDAVFVPANEVHGIDTGAERLRLLWLYNLTTCGADWTWQAVEPIRNH